MEIAVFKGYPLYLSDRAGKKYYARVDGRKVYFGDTKFEHYRDRIGYYANLDHGDKERRRQYKARHEKNRHKIGSAGWFADQILW